jgi:hypothetical protein
MTFSLRVPHGARGAGSRAARRRCSGAVYGRCARGGAASTRSAPKLLVAIVAQLAEDDELAFALACRRLHQAVASTERHAAGAWLSTRIGSAFCSLNKLPLTQRSAAAPRGAGRTARAAELAACTRLRMGAVQRRWQGCLLERGCRRASNCDAVGERGWLPVGCAPAHLLRLLGCHSGCMVWYGAPPTSWAAIDATRWWQLDRAPAEHAQTESVPSALVQRWVSFPHSPQAPAVAELRAARGGHLDMLQWLHASGCPRDEGTCAHAAGAGHLAMLQWLNANSCPWDAETSGLAAGGGHL